MSAKSRDPLSIWTLRRPERQLLLACLGTVSIGFLLALGAGAADGSGTDANTMLPLLAYGASLAALHLMLVAGGFRGDQVMVAASAFLGGVGLLIQTRMGAFDGVGAFDQARWVFPAGMLVMGAIAIALGGGRYRILAAYPWVWGGLALVAVGVLLVTGQRFRGALFGAGLTTPTEPIKALAAIFLAGYLDRYARDLATWHPRWPVPPWWPLWPLALYWSTLCVLLLLQPDLGMAAILGVVLLSVLVSGTGRIGYGVYGVLAAAGLGWLLLGVFEHGRSRIETWLDPFQDPTGDGWQILQGLSGLFAGGFWGEGFGQGRPDYTPIADSDFIYTAIGEELGFLGCVLIALFYLALIQRGLAIAARGRTAFGRLLATGLVAGVAAQTFLNIAGVTKLLPLTGVTLPLVSHGGASLLTTCAVLGLLLAISDDMGSQPHRALERPRSAPTAPRRRRASGPAPDDPPSEPAPESAARKSKPKTARRPPSRGGTRADDLP